MSRPILAALPIALLLSGCASALYKAAERGDAAGIAAELEKKPARPEELDGPLAVAAYKGHAEAVKLLLARGARPDGEGGQGTPLGDAAYYGRIDAAKALIAGGANVNARTKAYGVTPLMRAAFNGEGAIAALLIEAGADPNAADADGETALHWAIKTIPIDKRAGAVRPIFDLGGDPHLKRKDGKSPLDLAQESLGGAGEDVAALLREAIAVMRGVPAGRPETETEKAAFEAALPGYRAKAKDPLPEEARRFKVQAESMVEKKNFSKASELYRQALKLAPWWPEGWYNRAVILGELGLSRQAIDSMRRYLALRPDAEDARDAQDQIYKWEAE